MLNTMFSVLEKRDMVYTEMAISEQESLKGRLYNFVTDCIEFVYLTLTK